MRAAALIVVLCAACTGEVGNTLADDAGTPPRDDAGTRPDAGTPVTDAGTAVTDAGNPVLDAGTPVTDAGTDPLTATITSGPATPSASPDATFTFTGTGAVAFECSMDELVGGPIEPCTSPRAYAALPDGNHAFRVRAIDASGARSEVALLRFDVDTVAPTVTIAPGTAPPFTFTASEADATLECRVAPAAFAACTSPQSPAAGTFEVRATDAAGNVGPAASRTWAPMTGGFTLTGATFTIPTTPGQVRHAAVAHDATHDLYAVVFGNSRIGVTCITADGAPAGSPVDLSQTPGWTQSPWVAYSPQADVFLAAWFDTRGDPNRPAVWGRLFKCTASGVTLPGNDFAINTDANFADPRNQLTVAYSATSQVFLVAWPQTLTNRRLEVLAQRVSTAGALTGGVITAMPEREWYEAVRVAWNPTLDEFMVIASTVTTTAGVSVQRVRADGTLNGTTVEIVTGLGGTWTPQIAFVPSTGDYFATWFQGTLMATRVSQAGAVVGTPFGFAPGQGAAEGLHLGFSPTTGSFAAVFHGQSFEDFGQLLTATGPRGAAMTVTQSPAGTNGNFDPRIVAHPTRREWLVVSSRNFSTLVGQRLGE